MKRHISILTRAVLTGALALPGAPAWAQTATASAGRQYTAAVQTRPIVYAGLFIVRTDSGTGGHAAQTGDALGDDMSGMLYIAPCGVMGAGSPGRPVSAFATDVWQLSGKVIELTEEYATVQLGWRRIRRSGQDEQSPEQSQTLTLKRGDRTTIEQIAVPAAGSCEARSLFVRRRIRLAARDLWIWRYQRRPRRRRGERLDRHGCSKRSGLDVWSYGWRGRGVDKLRRCGWWRFDVRPRTTEG